MRPVRALAALAAVVTALGAGLGAAPPAQAAGTGTLNIHVVDEHGDPMPGAILVMSDVGGFGAQVQQVSENSVELPPGDYAVLSLSPWGGVLCAGIDPCDYLSIGTGVAHPDGSLVVVEGHETDVELAAARPMSLAGSGRVGTPLVLEYSAGLTSMLTYLGAVGGGAFSPTIEWLRDGTPISGAHDTTYLPTSHDVGSRIAARLSYLGLAGAQFAELTGQPVTPRSTKSVEVGKVPTSTFTRLLRSSITTAQRGVARVDATAKNMIVTGRATVSVGDWSVTRALRNGRMSVRLPALKPGTYQIVSTYAGTRVFKASTAPSRTLVVTRG
ncbi:MULTISPECIES: Ig-like domain-containing protein [unclassified Nocardioides]|uniref:Ig-like domain-containing protein n=1 Tax=unclassified Nocardioides TaxID=2615069 RepID=UPI0009F14C7B|nr:MULTISPECIES: Ig-like domain-containing protein [unclassified Nocardioides]GAW47919.1 hypothetical protein PD653B2_0230 [Nocardioides sp. PD653-B2]GAW53778.1 hypothetical protein PD653_1181 [Nocardioides sp. PD653]